MVEKGTTLPDMMGVEGQYETVWLLSQFHVYSSNLSKGLFCHTLEFEVILFVKQLTDCRELYIVSSIN